MTDAEMIKAINEWPNWPLLPLKRHRGAGQFPAFALLVDHFTSIDADEPAQLLLYEGASLFDLDSLKSVTPQEVTVEEILAAGWVVD